MTQCMTHMSNVEHLQTDTSELKDSGARNTCQAEALQLLEAQGTEGSEHEPIYPSVLICLIIEDRTSFKPAPAYANLGREIAQDEIQELYIQLCTTVLPSNITLHAPA